MNANVGGTEFSPLRFSLDQSVHALGPCPWAQKANLSAGIHAAPHSCPPAPHSMEGHPGCLPRPRDWDGISELLAPWSLLMSVLTALFSMRLGIPLTRPQILSLSPHMYPSPQGRGTALSPPFPVCHARSPQPPPPLQTLRLFLETDTHKTNPLNFPEPRIPEHPAPKPSQNTFRWGKGGSSKGLCFLLSQSRETKHLLFQSLVGDTPTQPWPLQTSLPCTSPAPAPRVPKGCQLGLREKTDDGAAGLRHVAARQEQAHTLASPPFPCSPGVPAPGQGLPTPSIHDPLLSMLVLFKLTF